MSVLVYQTDPSPVRLVERVAFFYPNGQFSRRVIYDVDHRDPYKVLTPAECYAIQFHSILQQAVTIDYKPEGDFPLIEEGEKTMLLQSEECNPSPFYFIRGKRLRIEEVLERYGADHLIYQQMTRHDIKDIVAFGDFVTPFKKEENHVILRDYTTKMAGLAAPE